MPVHRCSCWMARSSWGLRRRPSVTACAWSRHLLRPVWPASWPGTAFRLNWLPTFGLDSWKGYVLPVITLGGYSVSYLARQMRSSLLEVMGQDYIRTARAKGLSETKVIFKHALRNALIPVITVLGPTIANLLTGSFVVEQIFAIPGLGVHFVNSVSQRDYTTIMGVTVFYAAFLLAMVFLVDIFYCLIDPRIKYD